MTLEHLNQLAETYSTMSPRAQKTFALLSGLADLLADQEVRSELRRYLSECAAAQIKPADLEQVRIVLNAFDGQLGDPHDAVEGVVVIGLPRAS